MTAKTDEDKTLSSHSSSLKLGRMRAPTDGELANPDALFRPDSVLGMKGPAPLDASPFELHVAGLVDGVRPVARIKKRSGLSSSDLRIALGMLRDRQLLRLVGVIEEAAGPYAAEIKEAIEDDPDATAPRGIDIVPQHVMAEIKSMLDEDDDDS